MPFFKGAGGKDNATVYKAILEMARHCFAALNVSVVHQMHQHRAFPAQNMAPLSTGAPFKNKMKTGNLLPFPAIP